MRIVRLLAVVAVLWLVGVAFLGDWIPFALVLTVPGIGALVLCARAAMKQRYGDVFPWACCALGLLPFLLLMAMSNVHLHEFTGQSGLACDVMAQSCDPQPLQGLYHALSLLLLVATAAVLLHLVLRSRREGLSP